MSKTEPKNNLKPLLHKNDSVRSTSKEDQPDVTVRVHSSADAKMDKSDTSIPDLVFLNMEQAQARKHEEDADSDVIAVSKLARRGGETLLKGIYPDKADKPTKKSGERKKGKRSTSQNIIPECESEGETTTKLKNPHSDSYTEESQSEASMLPAGYSLSSKLDLGKKDDTAQKSGKLEMLTKVKPKKAGGKNNGIIHEKVEPEIVTWLFRDGDSMASNSGNSADCECCRSDCKMKESVPSMMDSISQHSEIFLKVHTLIDQKEMDVKEEDSEESV